MSDKPRCQSCGMPLGSQGFYGTNADGSETHDYCTFCFQGGAFTQPDLRLEDMIDRSVGFMTQNGFEEVKAREMSQAVIPHLKRWKL